MKIIGYSKIDGEVRMVMKGDSSLLVNRKPFFIPDWSSDVRVTPCVVLRVSRLGKNIAPRFASRYYDSVAPGVNICAADYVSKGDPIRGWAFDYSIVVGTFRDVAQQPNPDTLLNYDEALARVSEIMTIRQGDMIFIDENVDNRPLVSEEVIRVCDGEEELLYCKVK